MPSTEFSVAVFAHNEADAIASCLTSLCASGLAADTPIHVIVNGSTDGTEAVVRRQTETNPQIHLHSLAFGDKSNAWNHYVHAIADPRRHHLFLDGDVRPAAGSVPAISRSLDAHPEALAVSTLPRGGRRSVSWAKTILDNHGLPGNFYGLRDATIRKMQQSRFFLPVGLVGDDTLLRWVLLRDFDPRGGMDKRRIRPAADAFFEYSSFGVFDADSLRSLYKRHRRYSRRDMEMALLTQALSVRGMAALPRYISELYPDATLATPLKGTVRLRQVFFLSSYLFARRNSGIIPASDPWAAVFGKENPR